MTAQIIDGKALADSLKESMKKEVQECCEIERAPHLAVIRVGNDPASEIYVRNKTRFCEEVGIIVSDVRVPAEISQEQFSWLVRDYQYNDFMDGVMVQLPLPEGLINEAVHDGVDVDCQGAEALGSLFTSQDRNSLAPCTAKAVMRLLEVPKVDLCGLHMVIVGRSNLVGKPLALMALQKDMTVTVAHSKTKSLAEITSQADVLVSATGVPYIIKSEMVKKDAIVIDVGISRLGDTICGDVAYDVRDVASWLTPVPRGVGPMTVAMLAENTIQSCKRRIRKRND